nr:MAG TPA: hypothetical protein [Caudoviricetes sp.]
MAKVIITQSLIVEDDFDDEFIATEELRKIMADFLTTKIRSDMLKSGREVKLCRCEIRLKDDKPTVN